MYMYTYDMYSQRNMTFLKLMARLLSKKTNIKILDGLWRGLNKVKLKFWGVHCLEREDVKLDKHRQTRGDEQVEFDSYKVVLILVSLVTL